MEDPHDQVSTDAGKQYAEKLRSFDVDDYETAVVSIEQFKSERQVEEPPDESVR